MLQLGRYNNVPESDIEGTKKQKNHIYHLSKLLKGGVLHLRKIMLHR